MDKEKTEWSDCKREREVGEQEERGIFHCIGNKLLNYALATHPVFITTEISQIS